MQRKNSDSETNTTINHNLSTFQNSLLLMFGKVIIKSEEKDQAIKIDSVFFLNNLLTILDEYCAKNHEKIYNDEKNRRDDVLSIAELIYAYAGVANNLDDENELSHGNKLIQRCYAYRNDYKPCIFDKINEIKDQNHLSNPEQFREFLSNLSKRLNEFQTSIGHSSLRNSLNKFIDENADVVLRGLQARVIECKKNVSKALKSNESESLLLKLPDEVLQYILIFISIYEGADVRKTCSKLNRLLEDEQTQKLQLMSDFNISEEKVKALAVRKNFKAAYCKLFSERKSKTTTFFLLKGIRYTYTTRHVDDIRNDILNVMNKGISSGWCKVRLGHRWMDELESARIDYRASKYLARDKPSSSFFSTQPGPFKDFGNNDEVIVELDLPLKQLEAMLASSQHREIASHVKSVRIFRDYVDSSLHKDKNNFIQTIVYENFKFNPAGKRFSCCDVRTAEKPNFHKEQRLK